MNVITTRDYVAGIFQRWADTQAYIVLKPSFVQGFTHTNSEMTYPFYLLETQDQGFLAFQLREAALAEPAGRVLYVIRSDYQPSQPWVDEMGGLEHHHLIETD